MPANPDIVPTAADVLDPNAAPYNAVVRITNDLDGSRWLGSGVLISPDEVLTANHVSYKRGSINGVATAIDVGPGYNNDYGPLGDYAGTVAHYFEQTNEPNIAIGDIQSDFSIIHLSKPVVGGSVMTVTPDFAGGSVHVTGYPASGSTDGVTMMDTVQTVTTDPSYAIYEGTTLGGGSSGGPVWTYGADGTANLVGLVSAEAGNTSYDVKLTAADAAQIAAWVKQDDANLYPPPPLSPPPPTPAVVIHDTSTNTDVPDTLSQPYTGQVPYLKMQFVDLTPDSLNIAAVAPNMFIHTGSGDDAVALLSGNNVVDGGTGSNFLVGGSGTDTFFVDARGATAAIWSTVAGFHSGDAATLFGVAPGTQALTWTDGAGAAGAKGLTLFAEAAGKPNIALTLAGFSQADLAAGKLTTQFGNDSSGNAYLYVHAT